MNKDKIKEDILNVWDHAGLDAEMDARQLAKELGKDPDLKKAGARNGRQLQHPQVGEAFGREGVLGAMSKNIDGISVKNIATKNNVAAKKINAGLVTKIVYSLIGNNSSKALYFPVMWKPIINYFLGKLFGDSKITKEEYNKGIKSTQINEGTTIRYNINKEMLIQEVSILNNLDYSRSRRDISPLQRVKNRYANTYFLKQSAAFSGIGAGIGAAIGAATDTTDDTTTPIENDAETGALAGAVFPGVAMVAQTTPRDINSLRVRHAVNKRYKRMQNYKNSKAQPQEQ